GSPVIVMELDQQEQKLVERIVEKPALSSWASPSIPVTPFGDSLSSKSSFVSPSVTTVTMPNPFIGPAPSGGSLASFSNPFATPQSSISTSIPNATASSFGFTTSQT